MLMRSCSPGLVRIGPRLTWGPLPAASGIPPLLTNQFGFPAVVAVRIRTAYSVGLGKTVMVAAPVESVLPASAIRREVDMSAVSESRERDSGGGGGHQRRI